jgi:hypothetical protein
VLLPILDNRSLRRFSQFELIAHLLQARSKGFNLLLLVRDLRPRSFSFVPLPKIDTSGAMARRSGTMRLTRAGCRHKAGERRRFPLWLSERHERSAQQQKDHGA